MAVIAEELEEGRQSDKLLARRVLGLTLHDHRGHPKCDVCGLNYAYFEKIAPPHHHTTDLASAWLLVQHLRTLGWYVIIRDGERWMVQFYKEGWKPQTSAHGYTLPLAICRAALKAIEAEPKAR